LTDASLPLHGQSVAPIIEVLDLVKRYRAAETNAVDAISFDVAAGEMFVLLGPNGAGKTTTISILTTTLAPTAGTVRIAGFDVGQQASRVRREVGIIFQRPSLDVNLTAEENVRFHAVLYGLYPFRPTYGLMPRAYKRQLEELAGVLGLGGQLFQPIKTFSGGMMRKLEIIRSLVHRPRVLFLDEPTLGLDPASRRSLWQYIRQVRAESGTTIFLTTHYLEEAEGADRVCVINRGKIVALGTPAELREDLTRAYLVVDAADRVALRAELVGLGIAFEETGGFRLPLDGHSAHALLRAIETPLAVVQTHTPSLEDAYLAIVGREQDA
jgi:ABC-2 type transport system ATP-binding protein